VPGWAGKEEGDAAGPQGGRRKGRLAEPCGRMVRRGKRKRGWADWASRKRKERREEEKEMGQAKREREGEKEMHSNAIEFEFKN
jgi:hypothetical protein